MEGKGDRRARTEKKVLEEEAGWWAAEREWKGKVTGAPGQKRKTFAGFGGGGGVVGSRERMEGKGDAESLRPARPHSSESGKERLLRVLDPGRGGGGEGWSGGGGGRGGGGRGSRCSYYYE